MGNVRRNYWNRFTNSFRRNPTFSPHPYHSDDVGPVLKRLAAVHWAEELINQTYFDDEAEAQIAAEE
jgi:hypothetical protein